jgi:hypothetical protein
VKLVTGNVGHSRRLAVNSDQRVDPAGGLINKVVPESVKPLARAVGLPTLGLPARLRAIRPAAKPATTPKIFVIGCGRSGTTLLGQILGTHPSVRYLHEANDAWAAIEPETDSLQVFSRGKHHCLLDASRVTDRAHRRFQVLMSQPPGITLVEKNPHNTFRIGYLNALAPDAKFVNIIRDGIDVASSIERIAQGETRIAFRPNLNNWWGLGNSKWHALAADGKVANYYALEVSDLESDAQRGAYEWLVCQLEVDKWRQRLGPRLVEVTYQSLTDHPAATLRAIAGGLGLSSPEEWLTEAARWVRRSAGSRTEPLALPEHMCDAFNRLQAGYGFSGRAVPIVRVGSSQ